MSNKVVSGVGLFLCMVTSGTLWSSATAATGGYIAAVFAHKVTLAPTTPVSRQQAVHHMMTNVQVYSTQAAIAAKKGAQIIVFPEYGICGLGQTTRAVLEPYLEPIPDPQTSSPWIPCSESTRVQPSDILTQLSCIARNNSIYVVANMGDIQLCTDEQCPPDGHYQFNTNVVFDSQGRLIARYHKHTLFGEKQFDAGFDSKGEAEKIAFDTPFGRFGVFTCFDILFYDPAVVLVKQGIKHVVFPTAWMNSYPMLEAIGFHSAWARRHGVNLLAANLHFPEQRFSGSGVYTASGPLAFHRNMTYNTDGKLLVVHVPGEQDKGTTLGAATTTTTTGDSGISGDSPIASFQVRIRRDPFTMVWANSPTGNVKVCMSDTCCMLLYSRRQKDNNGGDDYFAFGAFQGVHISQKDWYFEACLLVRCLNSSTSSCGWMTDQTTTSNTLFSFNMTAQFSSGSREYVYPEVVTVDETGQATLTSPSQWQWQGQQLIATDVPDPLLTATLYARDYTRDSGDPSSANFVTMSPTSLGELLISVCFILFAFC